MCIPLITGTDVSFFLSSLWYFCNKYVCLQTGLSKKQQQNLKKSVFLYKQLVIESLLWERPPVVIVIMMTELTYVEETGVDGWIIKTLSFNIADHWRIP